MSSNVQAGLQAGSAFGPWGAAAGAAAGAVTDLASQAMAGPNQASATVDSRQIFDGSGWTVGTGGSKATGGKSGGASQQGMSPVAGSVPLSPPFGAGLAGGSSPLIWLALAGLLAWALLD